MDDTTPAVHPQDGDVDGSYLRRAQALLAARAELFTALPLGSPRFTGLVIARRDRVTARDRSGARQLSLPIPRDRGRRRARMLR
jgi:hypothetical protein